MTYGSPSFRARLSAAGPASFPLQHTAPRSTMEQSLAMRQEILNSASQNASPPRRRKTRGYARHATCVSQNQPSQTWGPDSSDRCIVDVGLARHVSDWSPGFHPPCVGSFAMIHARQFSVHPQLSNISETEEPRCFWYFILDFDWLS